MDLKIFKETEFPSQIELFAWLRKNQNILIEIDPNDGPRVNHLLVPIFVSPVTEDKTIMMAIQNWLLLNTKTNFITCMTENTDCLNFANLSPFKLGIIGRLRGTTSDEELMDAIVDSHKEHNKIPDVVKHPDFPIESKMYAWEKTDDPEFLPEHVQEIFVF